MLEIALIGLIILSLLIVFENNIRRTVVYASAFSVLISFAYFLLAAPDVALAEIIIGSTLSTIILLVAIKKYRLFTVYLVSSKEPSRKNREQTLLQQMERIILKHELQLQVIRTHEKVADIKTEHAYDLIVEEEKETYILHGVENSYLVNELKEVLTNKGGTP